MQSQVALSPINKSFITNLVAILIVSASVIVSNQTSAELLSNIGFFALSGAITNWLAIHMLFERVPFLYGSGVIPNQFEQFKQGIKKLIMDEFFHPQHMKNHPLVTLSQTTVENFKNKINYDQLYDALIQDIQSSSFGAMISMFGGASALDKIKAPLMEKIKSVIDNLLDEVKKPEVIMNETTLDVFQSTIEKMIDERLAELTPGKVKEIVQKMIKEHLGWLVVWGGVFGGIMGLLKSLV